MITCNRKFKLKPKQQQQQHNNKSYEHTNKLDTRHSDKILRMHKDGVKERRGEDVIYLIFHSAPRPW